MDRHESQGARPGTVDATLAHRPDNGQTPDVPHVLVSATFSVIGYAGKGGGGTTSAACPAARARAGYRIGDSQVIDSMMYNGLYCAFDQVRHGCRH